jgi:drug/metabolite transporter (DMT)-like permease
MRDDGRERTVALDHSPSRPSLGLAQVAVAVACFGLAGVLGQLSRQPAPLIVLGRTVFAGAGLGVVAGVRRIALRPRSQRDLLLLVGQGLLLAVHWTAFFQAINVSSVAIGLLAFSSFPLFTAAVEPLLLRHRASRLQVVAAVLVLPGIALLVPAFNLRNDVTRGVLWGLLAAATFAVLSVTNRWLGTRYASPAISLYQDGTAALVLLPALWLVPSATLFAPRTLAILLALGLLCTALAHTLFIAGMRSVTAQLASLIASLEPVWGILFAYVLLGQVPSGRTLLGGAIILCATMIPLAGMVRAPWPWRRASSPDDGV